MYGYACLLTSTSRGCRASLRCWRCGVGDLVGDTCRVEGGVYSPFKNFISKIFLFLT